jgi:hypothetical protein
MPQRQAIITVQSADIQGPDSWVKVRAVTHGTAQDMKRLAASAVAGDEGAKLALDEAGMQLLIDHVVDWNWVNDQGEPLPIPKNAPDVLDTMLQFEIDFLGEAVGNTVAAPKKS